MDLICFGLGWLKTLLRGSKWHNSNNGKIGKRKEGYFSHPSIQRPFPCLKVPFQRFPQRTKYASAATVFSLLLIFVSCSDQKKMPDEFQENQPAGYQITELTTGYGSLEDAYDSIDSSGTNDRLRDAIDDSESDFEISSYGFSDTINDPAVPLQELIRTDLAALASNLVDPSARHHEKSGVDAVFEGDASRNREHFYAFLDNVDSDGVQVPDDYLSGMLDKLIKYLLSSVPLDDQQQLDKEWLKEQADELQEDIEDVDFQEDFVDLTKLITKLLIQTDYPMWLDGAKQPLDSENIDPNQHTSLGLGNAVRGTIDLVTWLNRAEVDPQTRELIHGLIKSAASILDPSPEIRLDLRLRQLVENLEDNFTIGGDVYGDVDKADPKYNEYNENSKYKYSDAELGQTLRELLPWIQQLVVRSDRPNAMIEKAAAPVYPLELMVENLSNIGFDPDVIDVERSIDDLLRYDLFGRDRTATDSDAYPASMLESLLFLTQITSNFGWKDGGITDEVVKALDARRRHGHGDYTEELTLNDSLFSMRMIKTLDAVGLYELGLAELNDDEYGNHLYRTRTPFSVFDVDDLHDGNVTDSNTDYRLFYNQDYGVLQFLAGPGPGDLGSPDGGNPEGNPKVDSPDDLRNTYRAYAPNGLHETQLAAWTMGWGVRACFKGEGPYYYADPAAEIVTIGGESYYKYMRPDGRIYAFVSMDQTKYLYPAEEGDVEDPETEVLDDYNGRRQRDNRFKSQWFSDYYMGHYTLVRDGTQHYFTLDNSDTDAPLKLVEITPDPTAANDPEDAQFKARRLVYNEVVEESDPARACQSREEAFFRNYQWVVNEKKMVLVIPIYMYGGENLNFANGLVFQVLECNGYSGLANIRKYRDNHVWAKKNVIGASAIPGDYRISVATAAPAFAAIFINDEAVYNDNIDCGNATPAIVGHNLPALYRLAFPLSPAMDRLGDGTVTDYALGSKEFEVGDENWQRRNAFVPILFSLLAGLREHTPPYDSDAKDRLGINSGMRAFLNQTAILLKPLFYYNKDEIAEDENGEFRLIFPTNTWVPRVAGTVQGDDDYQGLPYLKSSSDFYANGQPETFYGSDRERAFYQPAQIKTLLNVMIDSDLADAQTRYNGILPLVTRTRTLSHLFKLLLHPPDESGQTTLLRQFLAGVEQVATAMTFSKGPLTKINSLDESGKGMIFPDWMFRRDVSEDDTGAYMQYADLAVRQDSIDLDELLDTIVGHDTFDTNGDGSIDPDEGGEGLADFPDCRAENSGDPVPSSDFCFPHAKETDRTWEDVYDLADTLGDLLHEDSSSCITQNLVYIIDRIFARDRQYTTDEISGMLYSFGKLFGHYDATTNEWIYQGQAGFNDVYNMLALRVPSIHEAVLASESEPSVAAAAGGASAGFYGYGEHYYSQLMFIAKMTGSDGLIEFLLNTVTAPQTWGVILEDLDFFLSTCPDIIASDSELWPTLIELLHDMGSAVGRTQNSESVNDVITDYGFQVN